MRLALVVVWLAACGDPAMILEDGGTNDAPFNDSAEPTADGAIDASADAGFVDGATDAGVPPTGLTPCASGSCYSDLELPLVECGTAIHTEDYSSGRFNVHAYATRAFSGETIFSVRRTAGAFAPSLILHDGFGRTLCDGERGVNEEGLGVIVEADGRSGDEARLRVVSDSERTLTLFVSDWATVDSGFVEFSPTDVVYEARALSECDSPPAQCVVAGSVVDEPACGWLRFIAARVVPNLEGTREERLESAARVAWWALKEGVLFLDNPIVYSNCNTPSGDMRIGPLDLCGGGRAWQVGLSAIQVPTFELARVESTATALYPTRTLVELLAQTASDASLDAAQTEAVVSATGDLRRAWLLRESAVGFTLQVNRVSVECVEGSRSWCYGTGWRETQLFAPDRATALQAIADLRGFFDASAE